MYSLPSMVQVNAKDASYTAASAIATNTMTMAKEDNTKSAAKKAEEGKKDGDDKEAPIRALDATDIAFLKNYGLGPYASAIKKAETDLKEIAQRVNELSGIKESSTGLAPPSRWDLVSDKQMQQEEPPLQVECILCRSYCAARCAFRRVAVDVVMPDLNL
jgi:hypothetical protein